MISRNYFKGDSMNKKILIGDCRETLKTIPDKTVQCCITSPPYFGLRDYGHDEQIGLEETPKKYVENMVAVFREVWRVLRDDGTLWLNLGDSYAGSWGNYSGQNRGSGTQREINSGSQAQQKSYDGLEKWRPPTTNPPGLKPKDLIGIPWRVAFALQADGWYLRQDIIWHKPNPMPESVTDRCTKAHEYIFLLSKSQKYFYDNEAVKEPVADSNKNRLSQNIESQTGTERANGGMKTNGNLKAVGDVNTGRNKRSVWTVTTKPYKGAHFATFPADLITPCVLAGTKTGDIILDPFGGSGTTAEVALTHGRDFVICELNPEYLPLINSRLEHLISQGVLF
jgi:DNA modification methylase